MDVGCNHCELHQSVAQMVLSMDDGVDRLSGKLSSDSDFRELLIHYLLGELPPEESSRVEELLRTNEEFSSRLQQAHFDLLDAYACGELRKQERARVRKALLGSPDQQDSLLFARVLHAQEALKARAQSTQPSNAYRYSLYVAAAAACVLTLAAVFLMYSRPQTRSSMPAPRSQSMAPEVLGTAPGDNSRQQIFTFTLTAELARKSKHPVAIKIPAAASALELRIEVSTLNSQYRVRISKVGGIPIASFENVLATPIGSRATLSLIIPRTKLPSGLYSVEIAGLHLHLQTEYQLDIN